MDKSRSFGIVLLMQVLFGGCYARNQSSTYPAITCYRCNVTQQKNCDTVPQGAFLVNPFLFTGPMAWAGPNRTGLVLPLQPFCYSYLTQIRMTNGINRKTFGRNAGYFGTSTIKPCFEEVWKNDKNDTVVARYAFCATSNCNTITMDDLANQCFTKAELRALEGNGTTGGAGRASESLHGILPGILMFALSAAYEVPASISRTVRVAAVLLTALSCLPYIQAMTCYRCQDYVDPDGNQEKNCWFNPILLGPAEREDCSDMPMSIPGVVKIYTKQKGYCATWIREQRDIQTQKKYYTLGRGCAYPGGEPDDCLNVNGTTTVPVAGGGTAPFYNVWTAQYCLGDLCNNIAFQDFINKCYNNTALIDGGTTPAIPVTRDFNDTSNPPPTTPLYLTTTDPGIEVVYIEANITITKIRSGNASDLGSAANHSRTRHTGFSACLAGLFVLEMLGVRMLQLLGVR
ncbi:uncharacterized protein LOC129602605 [Paramacrobiotus metropolitanus]|uniref:uncharacterized protein LOC129602605 n=1 Tax=Paramacrobiotus metropolitanus TaxID=2943436 RepID=UPI002445E7F3|nr:uncharacterized protein LOC129602605 [Paramacrobiotus metropolitanus]